MEVGVAQAAELHVDAHVVLADVTALNGGGSE
jgi:hypothetical protein